MKKRTIGLCICTTLFSFVCATPLKLYNDTIHYIKNTQNTVAKYDGYINEDISKILSFKNVDTAYSSLKVTGKRLDILDIYLDTREDKYVVMVGSQKAFLPIDKDGVVSLKDGIYSYWAEMCYIPMVVLVGSYAEQYRATTCKQKIGVSYGGYVDPHIRCWLAEDGKTLKISLRSLWESLGLQYIVEDTRVLLCDRKKDTIIAAYEKGMFINNQWIDCDDFDYMGNHDYAVGVEYLKNVLGMKVSVHNNIIEIAGELVPKIVLLENKTQTEAIGKPFRYKHPHSTISIYRIFGDYIQMTDTNDMSGNVCKLSGD